MPFAAFFMAACLLLCIFDRTRKPAFWVLLGALAGLAAVSATNARLEKIQTRYSGQTVVLRAEVEQADASHYDGIVDAVLRVEAVNGQAADFRVECETLPACKAGERVQGRFCLTVPEQAEQLARYADGIALLAEPDTGAPYFQLLGESRSFRASTHRLQQKLSAVLRRRMDGRTGGVLAAMTFGDRSYLSSELRSAYRGAGLSHVLVVSGLHVSILCGGLFGSLPIRRKRERSYRSRKGNAVWSAVLALLLVGVTGFTPSVCRAAVAVWVNALGVWVYGPADALTSLAAAGILMTARNSYAVGDIGFELSFAAVLGTLAGAACSRRFQENHARRRRENPRRTKPSAALRGFASLGRTLEETLCIAVCASAATFPVLVLRGLSVSVWAIVSSAAVLWLVKPMLLLGLAAAFTGLVPGLAPVYGTASKAAELLTRMLNAWAVWLSAKPGAGLYFDTAYAALVCLLLWGLAWLFFRWKAPLRTALPCLFLVAAFAIGLGTVVNRDVVHIDLVGSSNAPAVVAAQNGRAVVLFRGGASTQRAVETQLARRGVRTVELVIDLRLDETQSPCTLSAGQFYRAADLPDGAVRRQSCTPATVTLRCTKNGCLVQMTTGGQQFVTLSGKVELDTPLRVDWLLASPARPDAVQWQHVLALRKYSWMEAEPEALSGTLTLRPSRERRATSLQSGVSVVQ